MSVKWSCPPLVASYGMRCGAASSTSHTDRLIHPYTVKHNAVMCSKLVGPLMVRATLWQDNNKEMEISCYTNASQQWNGTRRIVLEGGGWGHFGPRPLDALERNRGPLRTVYKAKRASSVRSVFLWEPLGARAGWERLAGLGPGGDGRVSAALARSSRNLSNSERNKLICQKHRSWGSQC